MIIAWASHEDDEPYHGWVMSYSASTLTQTGVYCVTPNGSEGGVWQSGRAPVVDGAGNVYFITGNGTTDASSDLGESVLRFSTKKGLALTDFFTASNYNSLNGGDVDLGSSGLILLPTINLLIGGGKQGIFYLLNPADLGHYASNDTQIPQKFPVTPGEIKPRSRLLGERLQRTAGLSLGRKRLSEGVSLQRHQLRHRTSAAKYTADTDGRTRRHDHHFR